MSTPTPAAVDPDEPNYLEIMTERFEMARAELEHLLEVGVANATMADRADALYGLDLARAELTASLYARLLAQARPKP
jgi:hypothetical protein